MKSIQLYDDWLYVSIWLGHNAHLGSNIILDDSVQVFGDKNNIQISEFWIRLPSSKHLGLISSVEGLNILKHSSFLNKRESCGRLLSDLKLQQWVFLCLQPDGWTWTITSTLSWISTLQSLYLPASAISWVHYLK